MFSSLPPVPGAPPAGQKEEADEGAAYDSADTVPGTPAAVMSKWPEKVFFNPNGRVFSALEELDCYPLF